MNIDITTRQKGYDIQKADAESINSNFDRMRQDVVGIKDALQGYLIDLTTDVTGELPTANLDTSGLSQDFIEPMSTRRFMGRQMMSTALYALGVTDASFTDTSPGGANSDTVSNWYDYTSGAGVGASAGVESVAFARSSHNPRFRIYLKTAASLTGVRLWFGFTNAAHTNVDTHAGHTASIRYSTVATDAGWMGVCRDGTTQSVTSSLVHAIAVSTLYKIDIEVTGTSSVTFTVYDITNGTSGTGTVSANVPLNTQNLMFSGRIFSTAGGARTWTFSRFQMDAD